MHGVQSRGSPGGLVILTWTKKGTRADSASPRPEGVRGASREASVAGSDAARPGAKPTTEQPAPAAIEIGWVAVPAGKYPRGLRPTEIDSIIKQWWSLAVDAASAREILAREPVKTSLRHYPVGIGAVLALGLTAAAYTACWSGAERLAAPFDYLCRVVAKRNWGDWVAVAEIFFFW